MFRKYCWVAVSFVKTGAAKAMLYERQRINFYAFILLHQLTCEPSHLGFGTRNMCLTFTLSGAVVTGCVT